MQWESMAGEDMALHVSDKEEDVSSMLLNVERELGWRLGLHDLASYYFKRCYAGRTCNV